MRATESPAPSAQLKVRTMHEIVGDVVALGPETPVTAAVPTRVVGWARAFDGMADHVATEAGSIVPYPNRWSHQKVGLLRPLARVLSAVEPPGDVTGRRCAVLGLGPMGSRRRPPDFDPLRAARHATEGARQWCR